MSDNNERGITTMENTEQRCRPENENKRGALAVTLHGEGDVPRKAVDTTMTVASSSPSSSPSPETLGEEKHSSGFMATVWPVLTLSLPTVWMCLFTDYFLLTVIITIAPVTFASHSELEIGFIFSIKPIAQIVTAPLWSTVVDRMGLGMLLLGIALETATTVIFALTESYGGWLAARALQGICSGAVIAAGYAHLQRRHAVAAQRGQAMALATSGMCAGVALGPVLGGLLFSEAHAWLPFVFTTAIGLVATVLVVALMLRTALPPPTKNMLSSDEKAGTVLAIASTSNTTTNTPPPPTTTTTTITTTTATSHEEMCEEGMRITKGRTALGGDEKESESDIDDRSAGRKMWELFQDQEVVWCIFGLIAANAVCGVVDATISLFLSDQFGTSPATVGLIFLVNAGPSLVAAAFAGQGGEVRLFVVFFSVQISSVGFVVFVIDVIFVRIVGENEEEEEDDDDNDDDDVRYLSL